MKSKVCELCNRRACLYCESDSAFLCFDCDRKVHEANFLVARHVRRMVCFRCERFDGDQISGVGFRQIQPVCRSCVGETGDLSDSGSTVSSSSSTCISAAESVTDSPKYRKRATNPRRIGRMVRSGSESEISSKGRTRNAPDGMEGNFSGKAEGILGNWARRLGLRNGFSSALALHAFGVCFRKFTVLPFRVCLAASLWLSVNAGRPRGSASTWQLKKLQACSGVPAQLILLVESKLSRIMRSEGADQKEGWAECSEASD